MKKYLSGVGYKAMLGVALAGWISALQGDDWKTILPSEVAPPPVMEEVALHRELSVDGVRLGDHESQVRSLWGEPLQVETDLTGERSEKGYRYLRYGGTRMVVLRDGRVAVVDGGSVGAYSASLPQVGDGGTDLKAKLGNSISPTRTPAGEVFTYRVEGGATLHYALQEGRIAQISLSIYQGS